MFLLRKRVGIGGKLAVLLTIPLLAVLVWAIVPVATQVMIQERVGTMVDPTVDARTASAGRTMIWGSALEIWLEQPIFGVGYTGFQQKFHGATHNEYLRYLVDIGIVGFFIFMLLWRRVFACLFLAQDPGMKVSFVRAGAIAGVSGLLVSIFFVNLYKPWLIVWCIIGVLMCYLSYEHTARLRRAERARAERQEGKDEQDERAAEAGVMATK
jgi:O-antigen ligase